LVTMATSAGKAACCVDIVLGKIPTLTSQEREVRMGHPDILCILSTLGLR
jgi:hypothetical protein